MSTRFTEYSNDPDEDFGNTVKLLEDDIIDCRDQLSSIYEQFVHDNGCVCEAAQNTYTMREGKLNKPLQRKLIALDQIMRSHHQVPLSDRLTGIVITSESSYSDILSLFGDDSRSLFSYTLKNQDYKNKLFRLLRSICERVLIYDISLCDQYHYQVQQQQEQNAFINNAVDLNGGEGFVSAATGSAPIATNPLKVLWNEMRNRSCQFLGPQVQEDVLNLVLRALAERDGFTRLSRRVLVLYVVFMLKKDYPKVSKTSIGHVVQLLYRAGCFKVEKRDNDASLMELKREFTKYDSLRRQHDAQIIQIGMESGIRMTPEKWSQTLYGDSAHKSEMQSIIDKLQSMHTIERFIEDFYEKLDMYSLDDLSSFGKAREHFEFIADINFEKKQTRNTFFDEENDDDGLGKKKSDSSHNSEEDQSEYQDMLSEKEGSNNGGDSMTDWNRRSVKSQQPEQPQVRIMWSLLIECMERTMSILDAHVEFSSKIMSMIIANQNLMSTSVTNSIPSMPFKQNMANYQQQWRGQAQSSVNRPFKHPFAYNFEQVSGQQRGVQLIGMGPNWQPRSSQSSTSSFRNMSSSSSSASSYRGRNTPESGFSSINRAGTFQPRFEFSNIGDTYDPNFMYMPQNMRPSFNSTIYRPNFVGQDQPFFNQNHPYPFKSQQSNPWRQPFKPSNNNFKRNNVVVQPNSQQSKISGSKQSSAEKK